MAFSLSTWFKGKPEAETAAAPGANGEPAPPGSGQQGTEAQKARVTVRAVRTVTPHSAQPASLRAPSARQAIALPNEAAADSGRAAPPRRISFGTSSDPLASPFNEPPRPEIEPSHPPVLAGPDVPVILEVGDFIDRLPSSFLQAGTLDRQRKVEFRSSELYSDLTRGRASVPASVIYQKCKDIFAREVSGTEDIEVALPLQKLVEQMSGAFQTRQDQVAVENVGEIETPFLQVALEDNARLPKVPGTSAGPVAAPKKAGTAHAPAPAKPPLRQHHSTGQISTITPAKAGPEFSSPVAPPTAQSIGTPPNLKRPPSTVRASVAGAKIRVSGPPKGSRSIMPVGTPGFSDPGISSGYPPASSATPASQTTAASPSHQVAKKTARIQIPPISLRPAGASPQSTAPTPPVALQPSPVNVRPAPSADTPPTFRSSPGLDQHVATFRSTPPPAIKPPPPSFAPRRTNLMPPLPATPAVAQASPVAPVAPAAAPAAPAAQPAPVIDTRQISLKLAAVLRGLPAAARGQDPVPVPDDATVSFPFRLIEPQLSSGRVSIPFEELVKAIPAEFRGALTLEVAQPEVSLPLQEIFQNLPSNALSIRADQVEEEAGGTYLTPFSQKAEEDARRFGAAASAPSTPLTPSAESMVEAAPAPLVMDLPELARMAPPDALPEPAPILAPATLPAPAVEPLVQAREETPQPVELEKEAPKIVPTEASAIEAPVKAPLPAPAPVRSVQPAVSLQTLFMTEEELDAKTVVKLVCQLPGIDGCAVMFGDGLRLAGNFPESGNAEGFSAMSPPFYKRTMNFASELKLGELQAFTIYTSTGPLSFFMHDDICMSVRHSGRGFLPGVREKLEIVVRGLAQMYSAAAN